MIDITPFVRNYIEEIGFKSGILYVYCPHTTGGITINEGADPDVQSDIVRFLEAMVPENWGFKHAEGNSDSHIKTSFIGASESIIVENGKLILGTWQRIFFCEFDGPRNRKFFVKAING